MNVRPGQQPPVAYPPTPSVYPPPPEYYEERAHIAATVETPYDRLGREGRLLQQAAGRRRGWLSKTFIRVRFQLRGQGTITVTDILWLFLSAAASFAVYAAVLGGWEIALGLTLLILLHEMGHFVVIRAKGLPARLPIFVPFVGAFVLMGQGAASARDEAEIALAGPLAGGLGSVVCMVAYHFTGAIVLLTIALFNLGINLFNLLPIGFLDGGRASRVVSKWLLLPGLVLAAIAGACTFQLWLFVFAAIGGILVLRRSSDAVIARTVTRRDRRYVTLLYVGSVIALFALAFFAFSGLTWLKLLWMLWLNRL